MKVLEFGFFFYGTATTDVYTYLHTLSLHDALPFWPKGTMAGFGPDPEDEDDEGGGNYTADGRILTNIVMMGMGEPLYNFDEVKGALKIVMDGEIGRAHV